MKGTDINVMTLGTMSLLSLQMWD